VTEDDTDRERTARDDLYEQLAIELANAGISVPAGEFVAEVRAVAGYRVNPRQIVSVTQEMARTGQPISAEAVARVVGLLRGYSSSRQQRHAGQWRALGAALATRGLDGTPAGQRAFIGQARAVAGQHVSDGVLLAIALALVNSRRALDAELVGQIGKRLARTAHGLPDDAVEALALAEFRDISRTRSREGKPKARSSSAQRRKPKPPPRPNFNTRKWRPGGRRRRGMIVLPTEERE
jgi:hypothetical protein